MLQYNTSFLLKATAVTALCCLPMALDRENGFVGTAFLLPIGLALVALLLVPQDAPLELNFKELPDRIVEISTRGGRNNRWLMRMRIVATGVSLSVVAGFPALHLVDPEPMLIWLPVVVVYACYAVIFAGLSVRRTVKTHQRRFVADYLLFGVLRLWRRQWQACEGDFLVVLGQSQYPGVRDFQFGHTLCICRERRRQKIVGILTDDAVAPALEHLAQRVAKLVDIPYAGYREAKEFCGPQRRGAERAAKGY